MRILLAQQRNCNEASEIRLHDDNIRLEPLGRDNERPTVLDDTDDLRIVSKLAFQAFGYDTVIVSQQNLGSPHHTPRD